MAGQEGRKRGGANGGGGSVASKATEKKSWEEGINNPSQFKDYVQDSLKTAKEMFWELYDSEEGTEIFIKRGQKTPLIADGDYDHVKEISWKRAFEILKSDGAFDEDYED